MNKIFTFFRESQTARFLIPVGLITVIFGIAMFIINSQNQNYIKIDAIVSKTELAEEAYTDADGNLVEATYKVFVKYTIDGNEYEQELGQLSGYNKGDKITIYYNPENPSQITQTKSLVIPIVITSIGMIALFSGIISGSNAIKRYKKMSEQEKGWANE